MTFSNTLMSLVVLILIILHAMVATAHTSPADGLATWFEKGHFKAKTVEVALPYRLLKPREIQADHLYPLVLFFHGAGECGQDNGRNIKHGVLAFATDDVMQKFPAFVVAPQCGDRNQWVEVPWGDDHHTMPEHPSRFLRAAMELVDDLRRRYPIDPHRIYVTGVSMGGFGVWEAIQRKPDVFAAAVPVCGGGDPASARVIRDVPIWAFHGSRDGVVKTARSRQMIDALKTTGAKPRYTELEGVGHNAWDYAYKEPELLDWLFTQRRSEPAAAAGLPGNGVSPSLHSLRSASAGGSTPVTTRTADVAAGSTERLAAAPLKYTTSWVGNTLGGKDGKFVQMDARALFVAPDGTCYLNVPWEEDGNNAGIYRGGQHVGSPGRTHGWGNGGGLAVVANDKYIFIAQSRNSEGGHLHQRDPESYPPGDRNWFGLTRRTVASGGKESAPSPHGRGSGKAIQGMGQDTLAQLAGAFLVINDVPGGGQQPEAPIRGLALDNQRQRLYVSNPFRSEIGVYDSESLDRVAIWPIEHSRQMTVGPDGSVWVVQGKLDVWGLPEGQTQNGSSRWAGLSSEQLTGLARILRFSPEGKQLSQVVEAVDLPTGLAFDPQGRLLVSDNGPDQQVRIFDVNRDTPTQVGTFGINGGIYAGVRGKVEPLKFNGLQGVGSDALGNIYVVGNGFGGNGSGMTLESYTPQGQRNWVLHGLEFVDVGDFNRDDNGRSIYTDYEHFRMDYAMPPGREWEYVGFTLDRERFPHDPRLHFGADTSWVRNVNGHKLMYMTNMYSSFLLVYRFEADSEIAIPCGAFWKGHKDRNQPRSLPGVSPEISGNRFIWIDHNGNGQVEPAEIEADDTREPALWAWWVDDRGDVWQGYQNAMQVIRIPLEGFTPAGVPTYRRKSAVVSAAPYPFDRREKGASIERAQYYRQTDEMYLTGYTHEHPNPGGWWKHMGRVVCKYENWSTHPRLSWTYLLDNHRAATHREDFLASFDVAGEYVFLIEGKSAVAHVLDRGTGVWLAEMPPGPEVGKFSGWIDIPYGINAMRRTDGEYLLLAEEDGRAKNLLYRFRKPRTPAPAAVIGLSAQATPGRVTLQWSATEHALGYAIERATGDSQDYQHLGTVNSKTAFRDQTGTSTERYSYRVLAVGWGGYSPTPATVAVQARAETNKSYTIFSEDFEGGSSNVPRIKAIYMPKPALDNGGKYVGKLVQLQPLPVGSTPIPAGARQVVIQYDRLFHNAPGKDVSTHYTRQFLRFDNTGEDRHGESQRFVLSDDGAGKWSQIKHEIPIPQGASKITLGELANIAERATANYDNPVFIDNLRIHFE